MEQPDPYDPEATMFRAAAELERKGFTKQEIAEAANAVWKEVGHEQYRAYDYDED